VHPADQRALRDEPEEVACTAQHVEEMQPPVLVNCATGTRANIDARARARA
jgi:protein tyrosine phosphatase (PTP) superfamily phosphohydrolase (DUF442 family)